ncbi:MAG: cytidylate kinase-like family protein [Prevotellaceae bacterium]|jgi:cytidylate kinase|nr:cytidylate kinase-like family protein [Prevotellaceae bacterium]
MNTIINIGRQFGSGGLLVGKGIAERLGFGFYDKELIKLASKESGLCAEFFEQADEKKRFGFFGQLFGLGKSTIDTGIYADSYLSNDRLFQIQSDAIRNLAEQQSCVFVGRCADYILREHPRCLNVFITADLPDKIKRVSERCKGEKSFAPTADIEKLLEKSDRSRADYYNFYTNKTWGAAESYHLCVNTSFLGIDETVEYIINVAKKKFGI